MNCEVCPLCKKEINEYLDRSINGIHIQCHIEHSTTWGLLIQLNQEIDRAEREKKA
jgi:hypothetical protein